MTPWHSSAYGKARNNPQIRQQGSPRGTPVPTAGLAVTEQGGPPWTVCRSDHHDGECPVVRTIAVATCSGWSFPFWTPNMVPNVRKHRCCRQKRGVRPPHRRFTGSRSLPPKVDGRSARRVSSIGFAAKRRRPSFYWPAVPRPDRSWYWVLGQPD